MNKFFMLVGNIGSGKSTLCERFVKKGYSIISRDALRYMIGAGKYVFDLKREPTIANANLAVLEQFMKTGQDIVYDETNMSIGMREKSLCLALEHNYVIIAVILPKLSQIRSVNRRMRNPHGQFDRDIWESVWNRFDEMYEEPTYDEGFNKIIRLK